MPMFVQTEGFKSRALRRAAVISSAELDELYSNGQSTSTNTPSHDEETRTASLVSKKLNKAKQKKVSASTNMARIFTGGRSVFFFC